MTSIYDEALAIIANIQGLTQGSTSQTSTNIKKETIRQQWPSLMLLYNKHCDAADEVAEEYDKAEERFAQTTKEANNSRNRLAEKKRDRRTHRTDMDLLSHQVTALRQEYLHYPVTEDAVARQLDRIALIYDLTLANIDLVEMDRAYEKGKQNTETWAARVKLADEERHNLRAQSKDEEVFDLEDRIRALQPKMKAWLEAMGFESGFLGIVWQ